MKMEMRAAFGRGFKGERDAQYFLSLHPQKNKSEFAGRRTHKAINLSASISI
jgi:hypothetical protein